MSDRELELGLRAWYADEVRETETAPDVLRAAVKAIPVTAPAPLRPISRRRGMTLFAVAAVLVVGGALAVGSGLFRLDDTKPLPSNALVTEPSPSETRPETPVPTPNLRQGGLIAFTRMVDKPERKCSSRNRKCPTPRLWVVGSDGTGAHELQDGSSQQELVGWSPDGTRLLYRDDDKLFIADADGGNPQAADTGCVAPCTNDFHASLSMDGRWLVFVRSSSSADGDYSEAIATLELKSGRVTTLNATLPLGGAEPRWSPDGKQIVFWRIGDKDSSGPYPTRPAAIWIIDRDGLNLRQVNPPTLEAVQPDWSPDGARILFVSPSDVPRYGSWPGQFGDVYTMRPDGSEVHRLTTDGSAWSPRWTVDGRILFTREPSGEASGDSGWWTMDADGTGLTRLMSLAAIGVAPEDLAVNEPLWQPLGGAAVVPVPWSPETAVTIGPPAPTPAPTAPPELAPGFSWTGVPLSMKASPLDLTATLLADGRVLVVGSCDTQAQLYDPSTGTFSPTGSMTALRGGMTATLLRDGRVLFAGGDDCGTGDATPATAELYDPTTGTFGPTGSMAATRSQHTATLLADGRVLVAGGIGGERAAVGGFILASYRAAGSESYQNAAVDSFLTTAEIYDPSTGTFTETGSMTSPHRGHTMTLLDDGRVLVVGNGGETSPSGKIADLYDPATGKWSRTGSMNLGRWLQTATLLADGRVLITGGRTPNDSVRVGAEIYDPRTETFSTTGRMHEGRQQHTATRLADGRVLVTGGYWSDGQNWNILASTEIFDPATGSFASAGSMGAPRDSHTATLLKDGRVLILGGSQPGPFGNSVGVPSAVLYTP